MSETSAFTFLADLCSPTVEITPDSIVSRSLTKEDGFNATLFGMDAGQEMSEHSSPQDAMIYFISGEIELTLGDERITSEPCSWLHMPGGLPHSLKANTPATFILIMVKQK